MFEWYKDFENLETYKACFGYILYLMNDVCIFEEMQNIAANQKLMNTVNGDIHILQLAEDCYWAIVAFTLAHEIAHAYLATIGKKYTEKHHEKEEIDADMIAYHIVLKIIEEKAANSILEEYTYLAPIMYMDFFELVYYTDRILYKTVFHDAQHPIPKKRKSRLFSIVKNKMHLYDIHTSDGNNLYNCFFKEKTQRIARVLAIQEEVVAYLGGAMVGKTVRALVEGAGREAGAQTARLDNHMTVDFAGNVPEGSFVEARVTGVRGAQLLGQLVED